MPATDVYPALVPGPGWWAATPAVLAAALLLLLPGVVVARLAGARALSALAVAPALTLGALGVLVAVQSLALPSRALWTPLGATACVAVVVLAALAVRWASGWRAVPDRTTAARARSRRVDAIPVAISVLVSGGTFIHATGGAATLEQSNDSPFHLLAIQRVAGSGVGSWEQVRLTTGGGGFYPPLFDDVAALLVQTLHPLGVDPVVAANVLTLLVVALVWPLGVDALVRTVLASHHVDPPRWAPERVGRIAAMAMVPATCAFPAQLVAFGALWPNMLGLSLVPVVLAALVHLSGPRTAQGERASLWTPALACLVVTLGGVALALAHPSALLSAGVLALPMLAGGLGRRLVEPAPGSSRRSRALPRVAGAVLALVVVAVLAVLVARTPAGASAAGFDARHRWTLVRALTRVLGMDVVPGTHRAVVGVLVVVGLVACVVHRRNRWLVGAWLLAAVQVVVAGAGSGRVRALLTGLWYGETARLSAALTIPALVLAAIGAVVLAAGLARIPGRAARWAAAAAVAVGATGWLGLGLTDVHLLERSTYQGIEPADALLTPGEAALYARTIGTPAPGDRTAVVGDPFGGAMFAALYTGRPTPIAHFGQELSRRPGALVASALKEMTTRPDVCAAVRALDIGWVVEDTVRVWDDDPRYGAYSGLRGLEGAGGLELVAREAGVSVYRVTACRAG